MLGTVIRAGDVLDLFTLEEPEWGVTAAAARLGIGKSLAHEALATLTEIGLLQRVGHGHYRLGWRTMALAAMLLRSNGLSAHAMPIMRDLAERHSLSVGLVAWDRGRIVHVSRRQPSGIPCGSGPPAGTTGPADDGAASRVLLASRPHAELRTLWSSGVVLTRHRGVEEWLADLGEVRACGSAMAAEGEDATGAVAAPVRGRDGEVVAALSLAPARTCSSSQAARHVWLAVAAADRISQAMRARAVAA